MKTTAPGAGGDTSRALFDAAMAHYERTIEILQDILARLQAGDLGPAKDAKQALSELNKATQTAFEERARLEKRLGSHAQRGDGGVLDLAAARDEVGSRLARLRAVRGAGDVSG